MNQDLVASTLLNIEKSIGGLEAKVGAVDSKVDALHEEVKAIRRYEKRLGRVEGDVRTIRRVFGGLFSMLLAAGVAAVSWLKG